MRNTESNNQQSPVTARSRQPQQRHSALPSGLALMLLAGAPALAAEDVRYDASTEAGLQYEIQNPFALVYRLPIENQFDFGYGSENAMRYALRPRPVIPFHLSEDWSLITRTTFNFIHQGSPEPGIPDKTGLGDTDLEMYFSPKITTHGWSVGFGPVLRLPTATDDLLGGEKWGAGPAFAALRQSGGWTYGIFVNQMWSFAGESGRSDLNATYLQPTLSHTFKSATTFGLDTQSTYDWTGEQWTVPINLTVSQMVKVCGQSVNVTLGGRYYAVRPAGGPDWGMQLSFNFLFPK